MAKRLNENEIALASSKKRPKFFSCSERSSMLLDCPIELLFNMLRHCKLEDLISLSHIPAIKSRMISIVRVATDWDKLYNVPSDFESFPRFTLQEPPPEFTINICEVKEHDLGKRACFQKNFCIQIHIHNILLIWDLAGINDPHIDRLRYFSRRTDPHLFSLLSDERYTLITQETILKLEQFSLGCSSLSAPRVKDLFLASMTFTEDHALLDCSPESVEIESSRHWQRTFDWKKVQTASIFDQVKQHEEFALDIPEILLLSNLSFDSLKHLDVGTVNCLTNLRFPKLRSLLVKLTPFTRSKKVVIPLVYNISAPACTRLHVVLHRLESSSDKLLTQSTPWFHRLAFPKCTDLRVTTRVFTRRDEEYVVDREETFGVPKSDLPPARFEEPLFHHIALAGLPGSKSLTLTDCIQGFCKRDPVQDSKVVKLDIQLGNCVTPVHPGFTLQYPNLKMLKVDGSQFDAWRETVNNRPLRILDFIGSPNLETLNISKDNKTLIEVDFSVVPTKFPKLHTIHVKNPTLVVGDLHQEVTCGPDKTVGSLKELNVSQIGHHDLMKLVGSLGKSPVRAFCVVKMTGLDSHKFPIVETSQASNRKHRQDEVIALLSSLSKHFSATLEILFLEFIDDVDDGEFVDFQFGGFEVLREVRIAGLRSRVSFIDCPCIGEVRTKLAVEGRDWIDLDVAELCE